MSPSLRSLQQASGIVAAWVRDDLPQVRHESCWSSVPTDLLVERIAHALDLVRGTMDLSTWEGVIE